MTLPARIWRFGANFVPSSAINQLEMWQEATFDPETIDRELGWAAGIGMDIMRVFLHDLLWEQDASGFLDRIDRYLAIADRHGIRTMFVFFDDCWNNDFAPGPQPAPKPMVHNSGWLRSPGSRAADDPARRPRLEHYVRDVLARFGRDPRICAWDLYNEPGNSERLIASLPLLRDVFAWARAAAPDQPLTAGLWNYDQTFDELNRFQLEASDLVSFHCYTPPQQLAERIEQLERDADGREIICTEYMARTAGSTFADCLPLLLEHRISAINWGLVSGKTQTVYPWGWAPEKGEPPQFFHDVFQPDGSLLAPEEAEVFRRIADTRPR